MKSSSQDMGMIESIVFMIRAPLDFMRSKFDERSYWPSLMLIFLMMGCMIVIAIGFEIVSPSTVQKDFGIIATILVMLLILIFIMVALVGLIFLSALINHIFVMLFGGQGGYLSTFKASTYGGVVGLIYAIVLQFADGIHSMVASQSDLITTYDVIITIVWIISLVHAIYIQVQGFRVFHKFSTKKSWVVSVVPLITLLLIGIVFGIIAGIAAVNAVL